MTRLNRRSFVAATAAAAATPALAKTVSAQAVTVKYMLWDANQLPAYQAVADAFMEKNPDITIEIEQLGWDDYWTGIQTGMVSGSAPDVFTNHLAKYPEFASKGQLVDIAPLVERDGLDTSIYQGELTSLWEKDGKRYGLPQDWDTIAVLYNKKMLDDAGVDPAIMDEWTWNYDDGGTFYETLKKLTVDENGVRASEDGFDKGKVAQYGWTQPMNDPYGQADWSTFTQSTGWTFTDAPWTPPYHFDDERFLKTMDWMQKIKVDEGLTPAEETFVGTTKEVPFAAGQGALLFQGSWMIGWAKDNLDFEFGFGRLPAGPEGRKCMINGLAPSIWTGSKVQDQAWEWVKFLASKEAQDLVGSFGVVFPAIPSGAEAAKAKHAERGIDVAPFLDQANEENGTFLFPIMDNASDYVEIVTPVLQAIGMGDGTAEELVPDMNDELNSLF